MPLLRSRMVEAHAQRLLAADGSRAIGAELDALLPAFRSAALVPLSAHVAAGSDLAHSDDSQRWRDYEP